MKDTSGARPGSGPIPVLSPTLHCLAMPVVILLRRRFGYGYLSPKMVFLAFTWAVYLLDYSAWENADTWRDYRITCIVVTAAAFLYWFHLLLTVIRDMRQKGVPDSYAGRSYLLALTGLLRVPEKSAEIHLHIWIEPVLVGLAAVIIRLKTPEIALSYGLLVAAVALGFSEYLNFWFGVVRRPKVAKDIASETEAQGDELTESRETTAPKATRKGHVKLKRNS